MFISFKEYLINTKYVTYIEFEEVKMAVGSPTIGYTINLYSTENSFSWDFKLDEKKLAEKEFSKIKARLLGKDND